MPISYLENQSKKYNVPVLELEKLWDESKKDINKSMDENNPKYWSYVTTVFKNRLKAYIKDNKISVESLSLEDNNTVGDSHVETELCYIGYMTNSDALNIADKTIEIEQHVIDSEVGNGEVRVRKALQIYPKKELSYYSTVKTGCKKTHVTRCIESNEKISEAFFNQFKLIADKSSTKVRYVFRMKDVEILVVSEGKDTKLKLPTLEYEVDAYYVMNDLERLVMYDWVKIDVELDNVIDYILYSLKEMHQSIASFSITVPMDILPIKLTKVFNTNMEDEELKTIKDQLYKKRIFVNNI